MRKVYRNASILTGSDLKMLEEAYLIVEDEVITEIGSINALKDGMDMQGCILVPAFVNAHTHIGDFIAKEAGVGLPTCKAVSPPHGLKYRYLKELSQEELRKNLLDAVKEMWAYGITAFADFREGGRRGVTALLDALKGQPVKAVIFGEPDWSSSKINYPEEAQRFLDLADGVGIGDVAGFSEEELVGLERLLAGKGKKLAVHAAETPEAQEECRRGWGVSEVKRILPYHPNIFIHMTNPAPEDLEKVAETQTPVVCCTRTNCILADGIPPLARMIELGIPLALGTDNFMFSSPDMFREMDWFSRIARAQSRKADAVSPKHVLSIATMGGAFALGLEKKLGSLESGKVASFISLDTRTINFKNVRDYYSAIVHRATPSDINLVVSFGKEVYKAHEDIS